MKKLIDFFTLCENCQYYEHWTSGSKSITRCTQTGQAPSFPHCPLWASLEDVACVCQKIAEAFEKVHGVLMQFYEENKHRLQPPDDRDEEDK
jgi:alkylated DNA repair dioxygenase AlkB